jgi:hypothetical protein
MKVTKLALFNGSNNLALIMSQYREYTDLLKLQEFYSIEDELDEEDL